MTAPSLVEEVAKAIGRQVADLDVAPRGHWELAARAATSAVLEAMEEPSRAMHCFGDDVIRDGAWAEAIIDVDEIWRAMLAAFRKENGVE